MNSRSTTARTITTRSTIDDQVVEAAWRAHHGYLHRVASRVLGDPVAAEDAVQEAFGRLAGVDPDAIEDIRGWLAVVVRRVAVDRTRSAYSRRESAAAFAPDDQQPVAVDPDPLDRITLDDEVQFALGVVLDRLTPPERTSFVLHDVFGFPFSAVGEIVGRSPAACRQLASRARRSVRSEAPPRDPAGEELRELAERFVAACESGDIDGLMTLLDPDVEGHGNRVGVGPFGHFRGRAPVARGIIGFFGPDSGTQLVPVALERNIGIVAYRDGEFASVVKIFADGGVIRELRSFIRFDDNLAPR